MTKMNGGQALVRSMKMEGIETVFGVPGAGQYEIVDALWETKEIKYISVRNEQSTTYMADGYFRASHKIAGVVIVQGPGFFNTTSGLATAYDVSSPMLVITGTELYGEDSQTSNSAWMFPMAKWVAQADRPNQIPQLVHEAIKQMKSGRPRPVIIQISQSVLATEEDVVLARPHLYQTPAPKKENIHRVIEILAKSKSPVIWAGGGVHISSASDSLKQLAEYLQAPVVTSANGKGAISDRHPLSIGYAETRYRPLGDWLASRDVIIAIGTRTSFSEVEGQQIIRINIDPQKLTHHQDHGMIGDAKITMDALLEALYKKIPPRPKWEHESIRELMMERFAAHNQLEPQRSLIESIRTAVPDDCIFVQGMTQMGYYSRNYLKIYSRCSYFTASHHGTLGHAFPLGLGAKLSVPELPVVILSGDGGFLYNSQELSTAVKYGINVVIIVFNDNAYGNVLRAQKEQFREHIIGTRLYNPDFLMLAKSYGVKGVKAEGPKDLQAALKEAIHSTIPVLIEVPVGEMERMY